MERFFQKVVRKKPGVRFRITMEYLKQELNPETHVTFYTVVTSPDVLPLSCRRLVGAKPIN